MKVFQSNLWQINSTLVEGEAASFLFDPAYFPQEIDQIRRAIQGQKLYLVFTHADWDHIVGYPEFADSTIVGHSKMKERQEQIEKAREFDLGWYVDRKEELAFPSLDVEITGETVREMGGESVCFLPVPGHTEDMMATFFPEKGWLVAGDILSDKEFPFVEFSVEKYIHSLETVRRKVAEYEIHTLVPGHGTPILQQQEKVFERIEEDLRYLHQLAAGKNQAFYAGKPIPHYLQAAHETNVELAKKEAELKS